MPIPNNPDTIIIKNMFYPNGLTEGMVWTYYQKYKGIILNNTRGRDLMLAIMIGINKPVLRRKIAGSQFIQLTNDNFDIVIHGRTTAIYSTMKAYEEFCVIDIDTDDWNKAIQALPIVYDILKKSGFINGIKILYTGKNSFHLQCKFMNKLPINRIKALLTSLFQQNQNPNIFTLLHKRTPGRPNIDLSPNKYRGAYITEGSISIWGLKCMEVHPNRIKKFQQKDARIF